MELKDKRIRGDILAEYLEKKFEKDDKLKAQMEKMIEIGKQNYENIRHLLYIRTKEIVTGLDIKDGVLLLAENQSFLQKLSLIINPEEIDIFELFNQYRKNYDSYIERMNKFKKEEQSILKQIINIQNDLSNINMKLQKSKSKLYILIEKEEDNSHKEHNSKINFSKNIIEVYRYALSKIDFDEIKNNIKALDNLIKETKESKNDIDNKEIKNLRFEINYLYYKKFSNEKDLQRKINDKLNLVREQNKIIDNYFNNRLSEYDNFLFLYLGKIECLDDFIKKYSLKFLSKNKFE